MARKEYLSLRVELEIKQEVERIAKKETRSVSQVGEMLLRRGLAAMKSPVSELARRSVK